LKQFVPKALSIFAEKTFKNKLKPIWERTSVLESGGEFGRSVVANESILAGELVGIYPGAIIPPEEFAEKREFVRRSMNYSFELKSGLVLDPTDMFGYLVNTPKNRLALVNEPDPAKRVNLLPLESRSAIWFLCVENLKPGEELFTTYGEKYSRVYPVDSSLTDSNSSLITKEQSLLVKRTYKKYFWLI